MSAVYPTSKICLDEPHTPACSVAYTVASSKKEWETSGIRGQEKSPLS